MGSGLSDLGNTLGEGLGHAAKVIGDGLGTVIDFLARTVPGGLPVVVVLAVIAILVGLATFRR